MAMKGKGKSASLIAFALLVFWWSFPLSLGFAIRKECGRCVCVFGGVWGRRGCFFLFRGWCCLGQGLLWSFIVRLYL